MAWLKSASARKRIIRQARRGAICTIAFECHEEAVEQAMEEPRRAEEAYSAAHSNSPDIKENFGACVG